MILTQKLTSLAYALHDGRARDEKDLNDNQKAMRLTKVTSSSPCTRGGSLLNWCYVRCLCTLSRVRPPVLLLADPARIVDRFCGNIHSLVGLGHGQVPNLLEFFGHVFFFPGFLAGPVHQIRDYLNFIHGTESHGKTPSGVLVALKKLLIAIVCIAIQQSPAAMFGFHKDYMGGTVRHRVPCAR